MRKIVVFQSIPELLTYALLVLMLILNIIGLSVSANNAQQAKMLAAQNQTLAAASQTNTRQIEEQINCISRYFNTPNRTGNTTINNLNSCDIKQ